MKRRSHFAAAFFVVLKKICEQIVGAYFQPSSSATRLTCTAASDDGAIKEPRCKYVLTKTRLAICPCYYIESVRFRLLQLLESFSYNDTSANTNEEPVLHRKVRKMTIHNMVLAAQKGNTAALGELLEKFQKMFLRAARQRHLHTVFEDALQTAKESFLGAVRDFDAERGVPFEGFAKQRVYGDLYTFFRRERAYWQREVHPGDDESGKSYWQSVEDEAAGSHFSHIERKKSLNIAMQVLSSREKKLLLLFYFADLSLKDAAKKLGLSGAYASVVKKRALQKLKKQLKNDAAALLIG